MKNIHLLLISAALMLFACSPKTGKTTSAPTPVASTGTAPKIPLPTGNIRKGAPKAGDAPKIQIGKAETVQLDNGLTLIVVENHKLPRVSFRLFVDNDPVLEKDAAGYLDMFGDLLAKGTNSRTKAQIDEEIDFIGASLSSNPNGVGGSCLSKHTEKLLDIMSDVVLNPTFPAEELDKAKKRAESALAQNKNDASAIASNVTAVLRYGKSHPYGEVMTDATLAKVNIDQIKNHYKTYFKPNISYLVVTGDITKAKAEKLVKNYFGKWQKGEVPTHTYGLPRPPEKTQVDFVHKPGAVQSVINITYPIELQPGQPDVIRSQVANSIFGGYFNSRINANLREGHGWTYGARSSLQPDELIGSFNASASVRNAVTDSSVIELLKEMDRMRNEKVSASELQVVKNVLMGNFSQSLEQPGTVANFALNTARYKLPADYYEKYLENLQAVTPEEVLMMSKKYIRPDRAHIVVVGNKDDVSDRLKQFSAEGKVNFFDAYGNPVKMSNATLPPDMTADKVIDDYINAIGGKANILKITDVYTASTIKMRGPELGVKIWQKGNAKSATEMTMNGQVLSKRVYDSGKAEESGMGGARRTIESSSDLLDMKEQANICKEATYKSEGYVLTLKGLEEVNGSNAYIIEVKRPDGSVRTEYYDMKSSLKVREISAQPGPTGEPVNVITDFADYKATNGVMFPNTVTISGLMNVPMKGTVTEIKVNAGIDDAQFKL
jgi:zinc protease